MHINRLNRALLSLVTGVAILFGSTGFVIQKHECRYDGSRYYVLAGYNQQENNSCDHNDLQCCPSQPDNSPPACDHPDSFKPEPCCKDEFSVIRLPGFTFSDKNIEKDLPFIAIPEAYIQTPGLSRTDIPICIPFHNKHGGKEILILCCQSLT